MKHLSHAFRTLILLAVVIGASAQAQSVKMNIATGVDPSFSAFYLGKTQGIFEKNGLDVSLKTGPSGSAMVAFVVQNQIQSAFGAEQAGIQNFNIDPNVVLVAEGTSMQDFYGLVAKNVPNMDALKGKKIGVARGSASEVFWSAMVKTLKLDVTQYKIIQVDPPEMIAALERGDIDAFTSWEPWLTRATTVVPGAKVIQGQKGIMTPSVYVYMNKSWVRANPVAAEKFLISLGEANDFIKRQPVAAADAVSSYLKLDRQVTGMLMSKFSYDLHLTQSTVDSFVMVAEQLKASGRLAKPVVWNDFVYADLLRKVDPAKVKFNLPQN
jgi:NitT/TauT family transport system substrate-binding protein